MVNVEKEIELAIKRENPNWDGKSFDYGVAIYQNVLECWKAIEPIIEKAGHSGCSYGVFASVFKRVLDGKVLTPITDEDFFSEPQMIEMNQADLAQQGLKSELQCPRYSALFRKETLDGIVSYSDIDRVVLIDQYNISWHSGWAERCCKDYIPEITMPYIPADRPIKIYAWEFMYDQTSSPSIYLERGIVNAMYVDKIILQDNTVIDVHKLYLDDTGKPTECTPEMYDTIKQVIETGRKEREEALKADKEAFTADIAEYNKSISEE